MPYIVNLEKERVFFESRDMARLYDGNPNYMMISREDALALQQAQHESTNVVNRIKPESVTKKVSEDEIAKRNAAKVEKDKRRAYRKSPGFDKSLVPLRSSRIAKAVRR